MSTAERRCFGLAFDLDGPSGAALVNGTLWRKPAFFSFGAYGPNRAVPRILELLNRLEISATFFTPAWVVEQWPELCRSVQDAGHEVAGHGYLHETLFGCTTEAQSAVLSRAQQIFKDVLGKIARGFRAPAGDLDETTLALLSEHGYRYSSSFRSGDLPFRHRESALAELPAKSLFDDYAAFAYHRAPNFPAGLDRIADYKAVFSTWGEEVEAAVAEEIPVTSIWHPKIIGTPGRLLLLEQFLRDLQRKDISIKRCDEIISSFLGDDER